MVTLFSVFVIMAILPDTTARGGPTQPENMTCVLYAKRLLTCNYDLHDGVDRRNTTCTTCSSDSKGDICEDATSIKCNSAVGKCEYDCNDLNHCNIVHIMKITMDGGEGDSSTSMCRQIITKDYIQPGPVRNLRVAAINNTALRVSWKQPDDRLRRSDRMMYKYVVNYFTRVKKVKKTKSRDENVEVVLTDLEPWTNYTVTVRSRPDRKGFRGLPQRATNSTLEDAPASGPLIPRNPYSKVAPGVVEVYWSSVPREARRGIIVNYSVHASCCLSQPLYTTDHSATVNITGHSNVTVFVNAATKIGWSKNPSQLRVYRRVLDVQYIDRVHRTDAMLVWVFNNNEGKEPEFFTVSRCFGSQDDKLLQLVKCLAEVNTIRVPGNESTLRLREHVPPKLACAGCDWQYAVSAHVHNVTSPMVWNTPIQKNRPPASSMTKDSPVITALAVVVAAVAVAVAVTVAVVVVKRNVLCEPFKITMPPLIINDKEEPCTRTVEDDSNDNAKRRPKTPQVLTNTRDVQEDLQRVSLIQEQLLQARMQAERGDEESDLRFLLTISDGSNYKQVTVDTGKSQNQDCFHRGRDRSVPHNSTKKRLIGGPGPALKTCSLSPSNDCSDEVRQGLSQCDHIHPDVFCRRVDDPEEDEGWSTSSDSGVSTYRQVPIEGDLSQSPEDYQPGDSAATDPEDKREDGHGSDQSSFVPQKLPQAPSFASITDSSDVPAATAQSTKCQ